MRNSLSNAAWLGWALHAGFGMSASSRYGIQPTIDTPGACTSNGLTSGSYADALIGERIAAWTRTREARRRDRDAPSQGGPRDGRAQGRRGGGAGPGRPGRPQERGRCDRAHRRRRRADVRARRGRARAPDAARGLPWGAGCLRYRRAAARVRHHPRLRRGHRLGGDRRARRGADRGCVQQAEQRARREVALGSGVLLPLPLVGSAAAAFLCVWLLAEQDEWRGRLWLEAIPAFLTFAALCAGWRALRLAGGGLSTASAACCSCSPSSPLRRSR